MSTKISIKISKEEVRKLRQKSRRAARRLETLNFKPQTHQDKRTKRKRTRQTIETEALKDSESD